MDVYLIPVGAERYELYCEDTGDVEEGVGDVHSTGRFAGLLQKFKAALKKVEDERQGITSPVEGERSWTERMKDRALCWIAERIAEQRLLWRLRSQPHISLFHADDLTAEQALAIARTMLNRDADHHLKWTIIDGALFVLSGAVFLVPGPNVLAYYFGFRLVGHYLSRRGAKHALDLAEWEECPSPQLSRLRQAVALSSHERDRHVRQVAAELHLPHLAIFVERTAIHRA
jgi:hypothetical protein